MGCGWLGAGRAVWVVVGQGAVSGGVDWIEKRKEETEEANQTGGVVA